ncbi:MAG: FctA domain-containing protein, partial [Lachnospiraceae bacterium]|nr:FctA domain-containing protein [Lachnospiraceae bacterium]
LTVEGNVFKGTGLDDGTYLLTETKAPEGYKPIGTIEFTVTADHKVEWKYTSDELNFDGGDRTAILKALTGTTKSGDLKFADPQSVEGLAGTVKNQGQGTIKIEKTVTGTADKDKEFTFEITLTVPKGTKLESSYAAKLDGKETEKAAVKDGVVTVTIKAGQTYEITELPAGTTYAVTEVKPLPDGYSEGTHTGTQGTIKAGITGNVTMNNIYTTKGEVVIQAKKNLNGRPLEADQFSFELKDAEGKVLQTKKNAADGSVTFDAIKYTQDDIYEKDAETGVYSGASTKTYNYTINEVIPEGATPSKSGGNTFEYKGYTFDATVYTVAVVLKDNGDGTITATASPDAESLAFTNAYGAAGTLKLDAEKTFKNGRLKGDEFTFELKDADGKVLQSKKNDAAGNVSFDLITYKMEDLAKSPFKYTVSEVTGDKEDVKYDNTVYTVTVTLKDNNDGTLSVEKKIDNGGKLKFVNEQLNVNTSITLGGVKVLQGQTLKANQFKFVLTDENGKKISTARNDADGNFTFKEISYKLSDLNGEAERVYTYKVSEVKGSMSNVTYDTRVYTVKVTVTDNGDGTMTATADLDKKSIKFVNKTVTKKKTTSKKSGTKKSSGTKRKGAG